MNAHDKFLASLPQPVPFSAEAPQHLMREPRPGETFPIDALGTLGEAAAAIRNMTQAPAAIPAQSVLGVASLAAQGIADCETLHGTAPASLFLLTVAASGERKSACDRLAMQPIKEYEAELAEEFRTQKDEHRNRQEIWQARRADILRSAKTEPIGAEADLKALGPEPEGPLFPSIVSAEPTLEGLVKNMPHLRAALGIFSDEGGSFVGGHGMNKDNRLKTVAGLSNLWDGSAVTRWRAGDGVASFSGRRVSAHIMIQPVVATGLLADPVANGQGFLARFLMSAPESRIGFRTLVGHSPACDGALTRFSGRIGEMLRRDLPLRQGRSNELEPPVLTLSVDARELLQKFAIGVEKKQAPGLEFEEIRPFASKAAEHAARIAAVLTLYENAEARCVRPETTSNAITLTDYYLGEATRLANEAVISAETADAERLRKWLLESWKEPSISATDAAQRGPFKETAKNGKLLGTLERFGWVVPEPEGAVILGNRRRQTFSIVRGVA